MRVPFKFPIAIKLSAVTILLLLGSMVPMAWKTTDLFKTRSEEREKDVNRSEADARANEVEITLRNLLKRSRTTASAVLKATTAGEKINVLDVVRLGFEKEDAFISLHIILREPGGEKNVLDVVDEEAIKAQKLPPDYLIALNKKEPVATGKAFAGEPVVASRAAGKNMPILTIALPLVQDAEGRVSHIAVVNVGISVLQKIFARQTERTIYLIDNKGNIYAHSDEKILLAGGNLNKIGIVQKALGSKMNKGQTRYKKPGSKKDTFIGSFSKLSHNLIVISEASEEVILEPVRLVQRQVYFATSLVISASLFIVFVFSLTLTRPIEKLVRLTKVISTGNFSVMATKVVNSNDEVGTLAASFDAMVEGLKERDKVKNLFNKFHGSSVTESLLQSSAVGTSGSRKKVTVFFSDIRGFTSISEKSSPEQVVAMLNEYFSRMVGVIHQSSGVVDKFIGDAIMAVWGAPQSTGNDAYTAILACLNMRRELGKLNELRISRGESPLMIGMGLHMGDAISGTIGSEERMEYTVIGDTVNMASRIEAATKAFGTDLLVSEFLIAEVKDKFIVELAGTAAVKGKTEPLKLFKVNGYVNENGQPVIIKTPYSEYAAEAADKVKTV